MTNPSGSFVAVTPSNSADLVYGGDAVTSRGIFVGGAGNLAVRDLEGNSVTFTGVVAGSVLPIRVARVLSTGTTATNIVALF